MGFIYHLENHELVNTDQKAVALSLLSSANCGRPNVVDWEAVKELLGSHPVTTEENARRSTENDPMGRIFLVELVSRNPPASVVEMALDAYPDSLTLNVSCFFAACQRGSLDVVRVLTRHVVKQNSNGECPFPWITMKHVSAQGARVMLEEYPQGALQSTNTGACPLDRMLFSPASSVKARKTSPQWWEKVKLMLIVAEFGSVAIPPGRSFHFLNALLRRITLIKPRVFADSKESKDFLWLFHQLYLMEPCLFTERDQDGDFALHAILRGKFCGGPCLGSARTLIHSFLQVHPPSARLATREGRLALHLALENGWPCHDLLLQAAPDSLQLPDTKTGMYPFQTAACSNTIWQSKNKRKNNQETMLDVTFRLLREDPVQVARGLVEGMST